MPKTQCGRLAVLRSVLALALLAAAGTTVGVAGRQPGASRTDGSDWPAFLGPRGDARSTETGVATDWGAQGPPISWSLEVGEGYAAPAVAAGRLFHFDRVGDRARLVALASESGEELWAVDYPTDYEDYYGYSNGPRTSPVVDGDRVYTFGVEGRLRCHRVSDGALLWDVDTTERFGVVQNFFGVGATPVIEGPLLVAQVGGSPPGSPKIHSGRVEGNGTGLVGFDKATGEVRWTSSDQLASYSGLRIVTMEGRRRGFAFMRGGLVAFDPTTGAEEAFFPWRARILESVNASTPVIAEEFVLISETYGPGAALLRVGPAGLETVWSDEKRRAKSLATHWSTPVLHRGHVYASSGRSSGDAELRAVELATGEVRWSRPGLGRATALYVDGFLVVAGESGELRLVRATPERYDEVAHVDLAARRMPRSDGAGDRPLIIPPLWNAPVLSHGLLYLRGKDTLVALELIPDPAP